MSGEGGRGARKVVTGALFLLVLGAAVTAVVIFREPLWEIFRNPEGLRRWVSSFGSLAPLVFMALQALQVVIFVIPGEVPQIAGGYLFGVWQGALLSVAGIGLGSSIGFALARLLGLPFVESLFGAQRIGRLRGLADSGRARIVFFLLFVIPGIPKDVLCYVAGLSAMRFPGFFLISMLGRLPGILGSAIMGDAAASEKWLLAGIVAGVAVLLFAVGYLLRERITGWVERLSGRSRGEKSDGADPGAHGGGGVGGASSGDSGAQ